MHLNLGCLPAGLDPIVSDGPTGAAPGTTTEDPDPPVTDGDDGTSAPAATDTTGPTTGPITEDTAAPTATTDDATGAGECAGVILDNPQCGGVTPHCVAGACVSCTALDCAELDPDRPICAPGPGTCVQCQQDADCEDANAPVCDLATAGCVQCSEHAQCPETACNLEVGACFPADSVLHVENKPGKCSDAYTGMTSEEPLCRLQVALAQIAEGQPTTVKLRMAVAPQSGLSKLPPGDFVVAIVNGAAAPPFLVPPSGTALAISAGNTVFMRQIGARNQNPGADPLIDCLGGDAGARLWLDEVRISLGGTAIRANNCRVHVRRSTLTEHTLGVIDVDGSDGDLAGLWLTNSHINANDGAQFGAIRMSGLASAEIVYSTLALNAGPLPAIACTDAWAGQLTIRNSAIVDPAPLYGTCAPEVTTTFERFTGEQVEITDVFSSFESGVFRAMPFGPLAGVATWSLGDPRTDRDGDLRPNVDGSPDYAGADRPSR